MATPPILDDAAPGDAPDADADALLAWPEICDLMNLQAPDACAPRVIAVRAGPKRRGRPRRPAAGPLLVPREGVARPAVRLGAR